jgi:hypothetical protein
MRQNFYDRIQDKMDTIIERSSDQMSKFFKGTNPYGKKPKTDKERLDEYHQLSANPDVEMQLRQNFGDEAIDKYHLRMAELANRRQRNA